MSNKATLKEIIITVFRNQKIATINLILFTPNNVSRPVPVFLVLNHRGSKQWMLHVTTRMVSGPLKKLLRPAMPLRGLM